MRCMSALLIGTEGIEWSRGCGTRAGPLHGRQRTRCTSRVESYFDEDLCEASYPAELGGDWAPIIGTGTHTHVTIVEGPPAGCPSLPAHPFPSVHVPQICTTYKNLREVNAPPATPSVLHNKH